MFSKQSGMNSARLAVSALAAGLVLTAATAAEAADVKRRGGQAEVMLGGSMCIPSQAACRAATDVVGSTGPSMGLGFTLGFRPLRTLMIGAAYNVGFFNPNYLSPGTDADAYRLAYQNSFFAVIRGILPIWRFDFGLEIGPGFSRQVFSARGNALPYDKQFSQGFALKTSPVIDLYVTRQFFIGAKIDFLWNFHRQVCTDTGSTRVCQTRATDDQASVHQMIVGVHLGGTF